MAALLSYRYSRLRQECVYVARSAPSDPHARLPGCPTGTVGCSMDVSTVQSDPHAQWAAARIYLVARSAPTCTTAWLSFWYSGPHQELFNKKNLHSQTQRAITKLRRAGSASAATIFRDAYPHSKLNITTCKTCKLISTKNNK
jgi:hypothetical protein